MEIKYEQGTMTTTIFKVDEELIMDALRFSFKYTNNKKDYYESYKNMLSRINEKFERGEIISEFYLEFCQLSRSSNNSYKCNYCPMSLIVNASGFINALEICSALCNK